jgi:hypothetical protein
MLIVYELASTNRVNEYIQEAAENLGVYCQYRRLARSLPHPEFFTQQSHLKPNSTYTCADGSKLEIRRLSPLGKISNMIYSGIRQ